MRTQTKNTFLLTFTAMIWGFAFIAQSMGSSVGAFTFVAARNWIGSLVLVPVILFLEKRKKSQISNEIFIETNKDKKVSFHQKNILLIGGLICGALLFSAASAQQFAMTLSASTAKAGFITTMYVVLVPVFGVFVGKRTGLQIWACVAIAVGGLYFLCMTNGWENIELSDLYLLLCAALFSLQILAVDHYSPFVDSVRLSFLQFLVTSVLATICAFLFETPTMADIVSNIGPILYCGVLSSGVAFTLQVVAQKDLNPTIASIVMCLESVFAAVGGWIVLGETLTPRETIGCSLIFGAVVFAQIPLNNFFKVKSKIEKN